MKRRSFINKASLLAGASLFPHTQLPVPPAALKPKAHYSSDDEFWQAVRSNFALPKDRVYFNNGTMGPCPYPVLQVMNERLLLQAERGEYGGRNAALKSLSELINAQVEELALTHNTTEAINLVASGLDLERGDEVITTTHEHAGNAIPWLYQAKQKGFKIVPMAPESTAGENLDKISHLINQNTKVVALPHITCTTGHVFPVKRIAQMCRQREVLFFVDGAHGPGMFDLDMKDIDCDFYASCGHKWLLGPAGTGFLYIKEDKLNLLKVHQVGAYSDTGWRINLEEQSLDELVDSAGRFYYGTQSGTLGYGWEAAIGFQQSIGTEIIEARVRELSDKLFNGLFEMDEKVEMLSSKEVESRSGMIGFRMKNLDFREFGELASREKFRIRLVPESQLDSIRISTHFYNTPEEIDQFLEFVEKV